MDCSPDYGKESSLFVPSFPFIFRRVPAALCRNLCGTCQFCIGFTLPVYLKDWNIFCCFLSLFNYIIAQIFHLSSVFAKKIKKIFYKKKTGTAHPSFRFFFLRLLIVDFFAELRQQILIAHHRAAAENGGKLRLFAHVIAHFKLCADILRQIGDFHHAAR